MRNIQFPAPWRWAFNVFLVMRVFYSAWSLAVVLLVPTVLQNLNVFGVPVVAVFNTLGSQAYVFSREVNGQVLTFESTSSTRMVDTQTGSVWDLRHRRAVSGSFNGAPLKDAPYGEDDIFPYRGTRRSSNVFMTMWQRFDTNWFLSIAQRGYASDDGSTVYMPLYPLLIRVFGTLFLGRDLFAAFLISNVAWVIVLYLMYRLTQQVLNEGAAKRALIYLALFPTAFFFLAAYTESLFLALALGSLCAARKNNFLLASVLSSFAALTRLQGVLLIAPLAYMVWEQVAGRKFQVSGNVIRALVPLALIPLATLSFLLYANLSLLASYEGELHARFVLPWENVWAAVSLILEGRAGIVDVFNLLITFLFGAMCVGVWKKMPRALAIYTVLMFLAPLFRMTTTQPLVSMMRYVLVLFPVFMLWGEWGKNSWINRAVIYPSFLLSMYFSAQFWLWGWVA